MSVSINSFGGFVADLVYPSTHDTPTRHSLIEKMVSRTWQLAGQEVWEASNLEMIECRCRQDSAHNK